MGGATTESLAHQLHRAIRIGLSGFDDVIDADPDAVWSVLADADALGLGAPLEHGGLGLGLHNAIAVDFELGRRCLPDVQQGPALVADALSGGADPLGLASSAACGKLQVTLAGLDAVATYGAEGAGVRGTLVSEGLHVWGEVRLEEPAGRSSACVVAAEIHGEVELLLLSPDMLARRSCGPVPGFDTVQLDLHVPRDAVIGGLGGGEPLADPAGLLERARLRHAAYLIGLATGAHELAVAHVTGRRQFGKALMEFQAVAFPLAQAAIELRAAELAVRDVARLHDGGGRDPLAAVETLAFSAEAAMRTIGCAVQFHGASGLTLTSPMHGYYLAVRREHSRLGSPRTLFREAGMRRLAQ